MQKDKQKKESEKKTDMLCSQLEAVLFTSGDPVKIARLARIMGCTIEKIQEISTAIQQQYNASQSGLMLVIHDDTVQMSTAGHVQETVEKMITDTCNEDLSKAALEVLSIVAYRGTVSRMDIDAIRGVNSSFSLRNLLIRGLIKRVKDDDHPQTYFYCITNDFLTHIGLACIDDLPSFQELNAHIKVQQAIGVTSDAA